MLKTVFFSMIIKFISIIIGLIVPAVTIRYYSGYDFGVYSYLITYLIVVSIIQAGFVSSFRNKIAVVDVNDKFLYYKDLYSKVFNYLIFFYLLSIPVLCFLFKFLDPIGFYVALFISISMINALYPIVNIYFDAINKSVLFSILDLIFSFIMLLGVFILCRIKVDVIYIAILWGGGKGVYSLLIGIYIDYRNKNQKKSKKKHKYFYLSDCHFAINQIINVFITLLFMNALLKLSNIEDYGHFSIYYRFVFFPSQLLGAVSGILWIKYSLSDNNIKRIMFNRFAMLFLLLLSIWFLFCYIFMGDVVYYYASKIVLYPWNYLILLFLMFFFLCKDYLSIYINAKNIMSEQLYCNLIILIILGGGYFIFSHINHIIFLYLVLTFFQCLFYIFLLRKREVLT